MKITDLDKKILFELDKDGRASFSKIAREVGTTPQVVKYRFDRLMYDGAIKNFWAFIDYDKVGYSFFWAYWLKFSGLTKEREESIFADFIENKNMPIVMRSEGFADAMICVTTKNVFQHNDVIKDMFGKHGEFIAMSEMVVGLGFVSFPRTYLLNLKNTAGVFHTSGGKAQTEKVSDFDRKLMSILQIDGRMEFSKVAKILKVSPGRVISSFKKLQRKKIINKTAYTINYQNVGIRLYRVLFKLLQFNPDRLKALYDFCTLHENIRHYIPVMGNWQLMLDIEIADDDSLRNLLREMRFLFKDVIFSTETNEIYKIEKFSQMVIEYPEIREQIARLNSLV